MHRLVLAVVVVVVACKGKSEEPKRADPPPAEVKPPAPKPPEPTPVAVEAPPAASDEHTPPCNVLTREEAAKLTGEEIKDVSGGGGMCTFNGVHETMHNVIIRYVTDDAAKQYEENRKTDMDDPSDKLVKGVGTKAYRLGNNLEFGILANNKYVDVLITAMQADHPKPELIEATMKSVASRM